MSKHDIIGVGGPILDQLLRISEQHLKSVPGKKGGMEPIDYPTMQKIIAESGSIPLTVLGGSARNTLHGLTRLGESCAFIGMIGSDERGLEYRRMIETQGIHPILLESDTPTATVLSLVTPDGERTMRTFQGASLEFRGHHLDKSLFQGAKLVHLEGYTLFNDDLTETAMRYAQEVGAKVSFDLASFEIVRNFKDKVLHLLENYVDIIFANSEECFELTNAPNEQSCDFLAELCEVGVVLMGSRGCWVKKGDTKVYCPAYPVRPLDTTGAGDLFASGFLHAYSQGFSLEECGHYGAIAGRAVVQSIGAEIPHEKWPAIFSDLQRRDGA